MVRDPRAVVFSMQRVRKRAEQKGVPIPTFIQNITSSIQYTKRCIESGFNANKKVPGKILTVTYENIVTDPEAETKKICDFLRINWSQKMLFPANKKHLGEKAITKKSKEIWYTTRDYYRNPDTLRIGKWKKGLSFWEKLKINMSFQDSEELRMMDYNLSLESCFLKKDHWQASFIVLFDVFVKFYRQASPVVNHIPIFNWMKRVFFRLINT
jgi:hypothetical protein